MKTGKFLVKSIFFYSLVVSDLQVQKREICSDKKKKPNKSKVNESRTLPEGDGVCFNVCVCVYVRR